MKDDSSSSCREVHDVVVYIVLYDIYSNRNDRQKAKEILAEVAQLDFKDDYLTCYQSLLEEIVIPFLDWINSAYLAKLIGALKGLPQSQDMPSLRLLSEERADQVCERSKSLFCSMAIDEGCLLKFSAKYFI